MLGPLTYGALAQGNYKSRVLGTAPANLIAYWPLNEISGTVADNAEGTAARDGTYTGVALNNSTFTDGGPAGLWDGANDFVNIFTASLTAALNGSEGTIAIWGKVSGVGVWTGGVQRRLFRLLIDGNNQINLTKPTSNNQLSVNYASTGASLTRTIATSTTGWFHLVITWSKSADEVKAYFGGTQSGATLTGLGVWTGALFSAWIGANTGVPAQVWDGYLAHAALWTTPLSAAQVLALATI